MTNCEDEEPAEKMQINLGRGPGGANENCMRKKVDKVPITGSENLIFHPPMGIPPRHRE